jgi:hypothetical protein
MRLSLNNRALYKEALSSRASTTLALLLFAITKDVSAYNLFDPKPNADLRELSTDRPDTTESPYTVDAGHFQLEWEMLSAGRDKNAGERTETMSSSVNLKAGLTENIDAQLVLEPYTHVQTSADGHSDTSEGFNDTELRLKINVWGNDGGDTAFAIMPFVRFPTHASVFGNDGKMEGGVILPLAFTLPGNWDSAFMLEFDAVRNEDNDGYALEAVQSITFGHDISGALGGFFEFVNIENNEGGVGNEAYFNAGLMYAIGNNGQLDAGFNAGISEEAEDARYFVGVSWRY